ncbi:response regulator transcription factor [uncultured Selenomonas sp.]|uniref:response regulator n=1 Tax=uncultured Selenomonas sp. TaxID=159275 RepID=UPI002674AD93|nr:response regulator transcription factor [uncultured Selenomonas sp.]
MNLMIVDDHLLIRAGMKLLLKNTSAYTVTAEAESGEEALRLLAQQPIDLVIMDISMPGMGGLACIREIRARYPAVKILVLSMHEDEEYIYKAMQYGAMGYLPKTSADNELFDALQALSQGRRYLSPNAQQSLMDIMFRPAEEAADDPRSVLTAREREVFDELIHGYTITEIAERLHLSVKTVDTHKSHIYAKLNCRRRSELVSLALRNGLLQ